MTLAVGGNGRFRVAGFHVVVPVQSPVDVIDSLTLKSLSTFDSVPRQMKKITPGDKAVAIIQGRSTVIQMLNGRPVPVRVDSVLNELSFIGLDNIAYVSHSKLIVAGLDGTVEHAYEVAKSWKSSFISCLSGKRFGIYEHGYTPLNSLLNFLDIDDARPEDFERLRVFDLSSGAEKANLYWDPQSHPIRPALSYSGTRVARIRDGFLEVLEVN